MYNDTITGRSFQIRTDKDGTPIAFAPYQQHSWSKCNAYNIETFNLQKGDVILLHLHEDLDIDDTQMILEEMKKVFPNNTVLVANEYILKGLTILRLPTPNTGEVNMFDKEISAPDFLDNWLKKCIED